MSAPYIHPQAICDADEIGADTKVWAFAHVLKGAVIGTGCNIGDGVFVEGGAQIGNGVTVKNQVMIWDGVTIEDGAFIGPGVIFTNDRYPRSPRAPWASNTYKDDGWLVHTTVGRGASIGAGAVICPGANIGALATVAAGAVVSRDVSPHALVAGNPGVGIGWVCACGRPLDAAPRNVPDFACRHGA